MRLWLAAMAWLWMAMSGTVLAADTLVVLVRHAEKATDDPKDPSLTELGQARAKALADALAGYSLQAVYVTEYRRTRLTAEPAARAAGLQPTERTAAMEAKALAAEILSEHRGEAVLLVGHSNTVPALVAAFGGPSGPNLSETEYDRFYLLSIDDGGKLRMLQTRYGD